MQFPKLVGAAHTGKNHEMLDMAVMRGDNKQTWYSNYFIEIFEDPWIGKNSALFNDFMRKLLDTMVEVGLLNREEQGGGNYAIRPENIWISNKVKHIQCDTCQSRLCVAVQDNLAEGTHCLDYKCKGTYSEETKPELNYYQQVYNRNLSPRVHAHEHTGCWNVMTEKNLKRTLNGIRIVIQLMFYVLLPLWKWVLILVI